MARGHFPTGDAVVKLLWLAIINIEDKRARERVARRARDGRFAPSAVHGRAERARAARRPALLTDLRKAEYDAM